MDCIKENIMTYSQNECSQNVNEMIFCNTGCGYCNKTVCPSNSICFCFMSPKWIIFENATLIGKCGNNK